MFIMLNRRVLVKLCNSAIEQDKHFHFKILVTTFPKTLRFKKINIFILKYWLLYSVVVGISYLYYPLLYCEENRKNYQKSFRISIHILKHVSCSVLLISHSWCTCWIWNLTNWDIHTLIKWILHESSIQSVIRLNNIPLDVRIHHS